MRKSEKEHLLAVKELDCCVCGAHGPSDAHHLTQCGRRLGHEFVIPLCYECHRGDGGFSGKNRNAWDKSIFNQIRLVIETYKALGQNPPEKVKEVWLSFS